jgi:hypothetical protein
VTNRESHGNDGETKGCGNPKESDANMEWRRGFTKVCKEGSGQDGTATAAENKPKGAEEFSSEFFLEVVSCWFRA